MLVILTHGRITATVASVTALYTRNGGNQGTSSSPFPPSKVHSRVGRRNPQGGRKLELPGVGEDSPRAGLVEERPCGM